MSDTQNTADPLLRNLRDPGPGTDATLLRVCWQAADEIERLRAALRRARAEGRSDAPETRTDLWDPFGNDGMRHMESADVTGGATDMVDNAPERAGLRR